MATRDHTSGGTEPCEGAEVGYRDALPHLQIAAETKREGWGYCKMQKRKLTFVFCILQIGVPFALHWQILFFQIERIHQLVRRTFEEICHVCSEKKDSSEIILGLPKTPSCSCNAQSALRRKRKWQFWNHHTTNNAGENTRKDKRDTF